MLCHHQALLSGQRCFFKHNCGRLFAGTLQRVRSSVIRKTRTITAASSSSSSSTTMTTGKLASLQPQPLFSLFEQVTQVPRPSFHEDRILQWLKDWADARGLTWRQDEARNIVIVRPGSGGGEQAPVVALQSHVDMVTEKTPDKVFDFFTQGIDLVIDGEWLKADRTTLGADDGIGVATALALLDAPPTATLPPLEALFTVVEEQGMDGAFGLGEDMLTATYLLNLDTEEWGRMYVGSAGAGATMITLPVIYEAAPEGSQPYSLQIRGLQGGHSGAEIHLGLANAVVLLGEVLQEILTAHPGVGVVSLEAGFKRNAIPRDGTAMIMIPDTDLPSVQSIIHTCQAKLQQSFLSTEPTLSVQLDVVNDTLVNDTGGNGVDHGMGNEGHVLTKECGWRLVQLMTMLPNGVERMSSAVPGLVETSSNLGYVRPITTPTTTDTTSAVPTNKDGSARAPKAAPLPQAYVLESYCRSMLSQWHLDRVRLRQKSIAELVGASVTLGKAYPGWAPNPDNHLVQLTKRVLTDVLGQPPTVEAIHAGLECGLISVTYPDMQLVSFGPTILGAHTPEERLDIASVKPYWEATVKVLEEIAKERRA